MLTTSAFAAVSVRGLDFIFIFMMCAVKSLHLPFRAWLGITSEGFTEFDAFYCKGHTMQQPKIE